MIKYLTGVSAAIFLSICGWAWMFVLMGYQAQADITELKKTNLYMSSESDLMQKEVAAIRAITERTEKNTEEIRRYLLSKAIK